MTQHAQAALAEVPGMTSHWVVDDDGAEGLTRLAVALERAGGFVAVVTAQDADGRLVGACCGGPPALSEAGGPVLSWILPADAPGLQVFTHASHVALNYVSAPGRADVATESVALRFSGQGNDKFASLAFEFGLGGAPLLERAVATFECESRAPGTADALGRWVFTGRVRRYRQAGIATASSQ